VAGRAYAQLLRTPGVPAWNSLSAEDGGIFYTDALNDPLVTTVGRAYEGYLHVVPRLLAAFGPRSSKRALEDLRRRGVEVRLGETVESADAGGVTLADGHRIGTDTVIWAAGVQANPLGAAFGLDVDRRGRILVDPQLQVPGHPNVFAAGDIVRGASLVVWAIRDGRDAAASMHRWLSGQEQVNAQPVAAE